MRWNSQLARHRHDARASRCTESVPQHLPRRRRSGATSTECRLGGPPGNPSTTISQTIVAERLPFRLQRVRQQTRSRSGSASHSRHRVVPATCTSAGPSDVAPPGFLSSRNIGTTRFTFPWPSHDAYLRRAFTCTKRLSGKTYAVRCPPSTQPVSMPTDHLSL